MHVLSEYTNTLIINKSKFICFINKCTSEKEYKEYTSSIRKKYYDADHVCSALICGDTRRSSDDGEPSGTAGKPILNILERNHMNNTCALVVRYFGGIKLGAGGLIHAYGDSVKECLAKAKLYESVTNYKYEIIVSHSQANKMDNYMSTYTNVINKEYGNDVKIIFSVKNNDVLYRIKEFTGGIEPKFIEEIIVDKVVK